MSMIILCLILASISYAEIDPESIAAAWLFDEGSGETAKDFSENENDAEIDGGKWVDGKIGGAASFDGETHIEAPFDNTEVKFANHTYAMWLKQDGKGSEIPFNAGDVGGNRVMNVHVDGGTGRLLVGYTSMTGGWIQTAGVWSSGQWHHLAVTYDGNDMKSYLDGKKVDERNTTAPTPAVRGLFLMGNFLKRGDGWNYNGAIDEVVILTEALTEGDIKDLMNKGLERALGLVAVSPPGSLTTTWGAAKRQ